MKTAELTGAQLDYWVAKAEGFMRPRIVMGVCVVDLPDGHPMQPSTDWAHAGPIIERDRITLVHCEHGTTAGDEWEAYIGPLDPSRLDNDPPTAEGPTPLIAAMRAKVASTYGDEVPDDVVDLTLPKKVAQ